MIGPGDIVIVHAVQVVVRVIEKNKRGRTHAISKFKDFNDMVEYAHDIAKKDAKIYLRLHNQNKIIKDQDGWSDVGHNARILVTGMIEPALVNDDAIKKGQVKFMALPEPPVEDDDAIETDPSQVHGTCLGG